MATEKKLSSLIKYVLPFCPRPFSRRPLSRGSTASLWRIWAGGQIREHSRRSELTASKDGIRAVNKPPISFEGGEGQIIS